jgi:hypothetical protein
MGRTLHRASTVFFCHLGMLNGRHAVPSHRRARAMVLDDTAHGACSARSAPDRDTAAPLSQWEIGEEAFPTAQDCSNRLNAMLLR